MNARSPWRTLLYTKLAGMKLSGRVIDLGGSRKSAYLKGFSGTYTLTIADLTVAEEDDIQLDLEKPFPIENSSYDMALCINLLEHIYNYQNVLSETHRILKTDGQVVFAVPFLMQVHPSPHDHWRFTGETLQRLFTEAGFRNITVEALGKGPFTASAQLKYNVLHFSILRVIASSIATMCDKLIAKVKRGGNYGKEHYPLGYLVTAQK